MTDEHIDIHDFDEAYAIGGAILGYPKLKDYENFRYNAQEGLIKFGGSFAQALGFTLAKADSNNAFKILKTWKAECEHHANLIIKLRSNQNEKITNEY